MQNLGAVPIFAKFIKISIRASRFANTLSKNLVYTLSAATK
jgi:hypothetical protein